jgi:hypothetical protein
MATPRKQAATQPTSIAVPMAFRKETKGTYVYGCDVEGVAVTTVYVSKDALGESAPANIVLSIAYQGV